MSLRKLKHALRGPLLAMSALLVLSGMTGASAADIACKVVGVSDGDTITCLAAGNERIRVRLAQIDAPESRQPFGARSKQALSGLIFGRDVVLAVDSTDRYGRTVATVIHEGRDINLEMVEIGMAWVYRQYAKDPAYHASEERARKNSRGLWSHPDPVPPWLWRRGEGQKPLVRPPAEAIACTMDAKQCPDGSWVARQPPSCQFAPCPGR